MKNFRISFIALSKSVDMDIKSEHEVDNIVTDLLMVFAKEIDYKSFKISINSLQQNTEDLRNKMNSVVQHYKDYEKKIQRINSYLNDLKDNEYFFILPDTTISKEKSFQFYNYLLAIERGEDFEEMTKEMDTIFGNLMNSYEMFVFDENTRHNIGERDKSKRVCRYCNKSNPEVSFKKVAHSISEALGNKKIITNDECDTCNEKFGKGIENDLILYLSFFRNFFGIKGKKGIPILKGKNFEIVNNGTIEIKQILSDEEIKNRVHDDFKLLLKTYQNITAQNIYKTLAKYALGVIDRAQIANFEETLAWINGTKDIDNLPKVAMLASYDLFSTHPKLIVYLRKNEDCKLPYAVAEFRFTFLTFVYIIPNSTKDTADFTQDDNYKYFWDFFKHYSKVSNWTYIDLNDSTAKPFVINLNFDESKK